MRRLINRIGAALVAFAIPGTVSAQTVDEQLAAMVEAWVEAEATNFIGELRQYLTHCIVPVTTALPESAKQSLAEIGDMDAGLEAMEDTDPAALEQFRAGIDPCVETAFQFGGDVLDWVFVTQMTGAAREELLQASFCVLDIVLPLELEDKQALKLGLDIRDADFRAHGIAALIAARPDLAESLNADLDNCIAMD